MQTKIKKAAGLTAAGQNKLQSELYRKTANPSSLKINLLVELRGIVKGLLNPFLTQAEKDTCKLLYRSTVHKLNVLPNIPKKIPEQTELKQLELFV